MIQNVTFTVWKWLLSIMQISLLPALNADIVILMRRKKYVIYELISLIITFVFEKYYFDDKKIEVLLIL